MATHSSVLDWSIPGTAEPGGLPSMGSRRVGHDWRDAAAAAMVFYLKGHMTSAHTGVISSLTLYYYFSCLLTPGSLRPENGSLFLWFQVPLPWPITVSPALNPFWWPPVTFSLRENCDCDSYQPPNTHTHITWKQPREGQRHCRAARSPGP